MNAPVLPESSPFTSEQRNWLNGFLAGLANVGFGSLAQASAAAGIASAAGNGSSISASPVTSKLPVLILFGSQSGTAEGLAMALADKLKAYAGKSVQFQPRVVGMDKFQDIDFAAESRILMLSSTWGDGDMPDHAVAFWEWLKSPQAPSLAHAAFAVMGLGDRNYTRFCQAGKNLDGRCADLGATRLLPLCECDTDYEAKADAWMDEAMNALETHAGGQALPPDAMPEPSANGSANGSANSASKSAANASGYTPANGSTLAIPAPVLNGNAVASANGKALSAPINGQHAALSASSAAAGASATYGRKHPFPAPLLENHPLNAKGSGKDTRHLAFSLLGSGLEYKVGDALGVFPRNCYELVDRIILSLNCLGNERVTLDDGEATALRAALISKLDLRRGSEKLLLGLRAESRNLGETRRLRDLLEDPAQANAYLTGRDVLDVLEDFPHTRLDAQTFTGSLAKIAPRLYSISSSPKENPGEVHLTVGVVRYASGHRLRRGVASTFLAERVPLGMTVPVFIQPTSHFTLPSQPGKPIIMVGPGTGVAPFRAFLQERRNTGDTGRNWLFFGDQRRRLDFLYSEEFVAMEASGFLTKMDLAFSRDQDEKVYVQTRMLEQSKELFAWLEDGAHFYVCGDAKRMAKDVEEALLHVIAKESGKGLDGAKAYLDGMKSQKRYQRDVY